MFVKRYIAKDMSQAIDRIQKELGPEAVILNSKPIRKKGLSGLFQKKLVEVVVAYEPAGKGPISLEYDKEAPITLQQAVDHMFSPKDLDSDKIVILSEKLDTLSDVVEEFSQKIRTVDTTSTLRFSPRIQEWHEKLTGADIGNELAYEICKQTQDVVERTNMHEDDVLTDLLTEKMGMAMPLKLKKFQRNVIMLIGPTGMGKTTTLVKLAGQYMVNEGLKVGIINTDTYRISAQDQLKTYAEIMGIPVHTVYSPGELATAMEAMADRDIVLIDTAGKASGNLEYRQELTQLLEAGEIDEVLLTLSLVTGCTAAKEIIDNYAYIPDYKIVVTKLDEMSAWGNILNIASYSKRPLCYITTGQSVPDDIEAVDVKHIVEHIMGRRPI
ncbi:flagellar biosynthesis protein FlhF [Eubacteriales bacterium OttesenSCG-928-N14]|nr:flagellar biosynthesis protein FlhF [Eubacteriales bacterium OttesenSCG-928-N14]